MDYSPELGGLIYQVSSMARREGGISFAGGYPDPALFDVDGLAQAFDAMFADGFRAALQYGEREGFGPLRERLAGFSGSAGTPVTTDQVVVTNGGQQGLDLAVRVLLQPGDVVAMDSPVFPTALQAFQLAGVSARNVASDADGLIPDSLEQICRRDAPRLLYLVPSYSNPGGTLLSRQRRLQLLDIAVRHKLMVLEDDPYSHIWFDTPSPPSLLALSGQVPGSREQLIHVSSLSKLVAPALRVGWVIPPPSLLRSFVLAKQATDIHSAIPTQVALERYWASGRFDAHIPVIRDSYRERAMAMDRALAAHMAPHGRWVSPRGGMFMWLHLDAVPDTRDLVDAARRERVYFVPGVAFYPNQPDTATLRLSFATTPSAQMDEGIASLARAVASVSQ